MPSAPFEEQRVTRAAQSFPLVAQNRDSLSPKAKKKFAKKRMTAVLRYCVMVYRVNVLCNNNPVMAICVKVELVYVLTAFAAIAFAKNTT